MTSYLGIFELQGDFCEHSPRRQEIGKLFLISSYS